MMKNKYLFVIIVFALLMSFVPSIGKAETITGIKINDIPIKMSKQPIVKDGRTLVPVREIFESLGLSLEWDQAAKEIKVRKLDKEIVFYIDNKLAFINRDPVILRTPPIIYKGTTYIPIKIVADSLNGQVTLDSIANRILIDLPLTADERATILQLEQQKYDDYRHDLMERQRINNLKYQANYLRSLKLKTSSKYMSVDTRIYNTIIEMKVIKLGIESRTSINTNIKNLMYNKDSEVLLNTDQRAYQTITTSFLLNEVTVDKAIELLSELYKQRKS